MSRQNKGYFSANKFKKEGTKQPDYRGLVGCTCPNCGTHTDFALSGWVNERTDPDTGETDNYVGLESSIKQERPEPPKDNTPSSMAEVRKKTGF